MNEGRCKKMRFLKLLVAVFAGALFLTSCNLIQPDETAEINSQRNDIAPAEIVSEEDNYYARENFDLQTIGPLLERARNAEELEYLINSDPRINNLDLNRDGYADYISVAEFQDRDDGERGLSLFSRFGPDLIQEIATIIFDRGGFNSPGARILLAGDELLYGDNYYHEANWLDRALPIISWLFSDRDSYYESPYYYNNYPDYYQAYEVVETPVYLTRVREIYSEPVFVYTTNPTVTQIEINSPYEGKTVTNVYPIPVKRVNERAESRRNKQGPPEFVPVRKGWEKNGGPKFDKHPKGNPDDFERPRKNNDVKFEKRERPNNARIEVPKPPKAERPQKAERPNFNPNKPPRIENPGMKPPKPDNPGRGKGAGNNPGKGNGGGNPGGGKGNAGGGGKGGGKKP
jgi:hypothetical protein